MGKLGEHRGKPVMGASVKITNAGDGLTKPLAAEPRLFPSGAVVPVLVWCKVGNEDYDPIEVDGDEDTVIGYRLKFNFKAQEAFPLDHVKPETLDALVGDQREQVRLWELEEKRKKAEAKGEMALDGTEPGGAVDEKPSWSERALAADGVIETSEVAEAPERPEGMSDVDWEASARAASVTGIGSKQARKAKG